MIVEARVVDGGVELGEGGVADFEFNDEDLHHFVDVEFRRSGKEKDFSSELIQTNEISIINHRGLSFRSGQNAPRSD